MHLRPPPPPPVQTGHRIDLEEGLLQYVNCALAQVESQQQQQQQQEEEEEVKVEQQQHPIVHHETAADAVYAQPSTRGQQLTSLQQTNVSSATLAVAPDLEAEHAAALSMLALSSTVHHVPHPSHSH